MQIVILAGGLGTRLSEETGVIPKPMVSIGDSPIILHLMRYFASYGHKDFLIALGYKGYVLKEFFSNFATHNSDIEIDLKSKNVQIVKALNEDWRIKLVDTGLETLTGGRLLRLKDYLDSEFIMTYGDGLANVNLEELVKFHQKHKRKATVTAVRPPARFGAIEINDSVVTRFAEKSPQDSGWINGGFFVFSKDICNYIAGDTTVLEGEPLESLVKENDLMAFKHEGFWQPMDTLRDKKVLENIWQAGSAPWLR
jgi:glucose-1-phosphate cytidylyltransferase